MSGIIFYRTAKMEKIEKFYLSKLNFRLWLDQGKCKIFQSGNQLLGFCKSDESDTDGIITTFFDKKKKVDTMYKKLNSIASCEPRENENFKIYQFFAKDPEGRTLEFQYFNHFLKPYKNGKEIFTQRRSYRKFKNKKVNGEILNKIFNDSRFSPTSMNSQSYYYIVIKNKEIQKELSLIRGKSSSPINNSSIAVAICVDESKTKRVKQDGDIAAYHFMLSAFNYGLGTCWIADMNRKSVKKLINIPQKDYVATVTPLGYPVEYKNIPERRNTDKFVKYIE